MMSVAQKLIKLFPREDRPYLNRLVVRSGVLLATNAHVTIMSSSDLPDGDYDFELSPIEVYAEFPSEQLYSYFSNLMSMPESSFEKIWDQKYSGMHMVKEVRAGKTSVTPQYFGLIEDGLISLRSGPLLGVSQAIAGEHSEGLFIIAGVVPDAN